jgi:hypothetical protein
MCGANTSKNAGKRLSGVKLARPIVPPGRHTRVSSAEARRWSGTNITPKHDVTTSKAPSSNGNDSASASTHSSSTPQALASRRPASKLSGVRSAATTPAPACAARIATFPDPAATSSTRWPGPIAHASTITGPTSQTVAFAKRW